jgi:hypothetical protein
VKATRSLGSYLVLLRKESVHGDELGVPRRVQIEVRAVVPARDHLSVAHEHAPHRDLPLAQRCNRLLLCEPHEPLIILAHAESVQVLSSEVVQVI